MSDEPQITGTTLTPHEYGTLREVAGAMERTVNLYGPDPTRRVNADREVTFTATHGETGVPFEVTVRVPHPA